MKIKVNSTTHEAIQKALFAIVCVWWGDSTKDLFTPDDDDVSSTWWLFVDHDRKISYGDWEWGLQHKSKEVQPPEEWRVDNED